MRRVAAEFTDSDKWNDLGSIPDEIPPQTPSGFSTRAPHPMTLKIFLRLRFACRMFPMQRLSRLVMLITILAAPAYAQSGKIGEVRVVKRYVRVSPDLELYYEEAGRVRP
jgi:hypothetical protein